MKKLSSICFVIVLVCCLLCTFAACNGGTPDSGGGDKDSAPTTEVKVLVAYFSATNTTKGVAEKIASATGGTLYAITPAQSYTSADLNYNDANSRSSKEHNNLEARPEISGIVQNMENYDVVFVGYPIWWGEAPKIVYTFLESYDFNGKTIVPFCTSASSGVGSSATRLHALTSGATWLEGRRFSGDVSQSVINDYVASLKIVSAD